MLKAETNSLSFQILQFLTTFPVPLVTTLIVIDLTVEIGVMSIGRFFLL